MNHGTITYDGDTHWLECERCDEELCTVEAGDSLESLVIAANQHICPTGASDGVAGQI